MSLQKRECDNEESCAGRGAGRADHGCGPCSGPDKAPSRAQCGHTIQLANAAAGHAAPRSKTAGKPEIIRAVDKSVAGCPVLVSMSGRMTAPRAYADGPATVSPAR
jgi:hypothetical protein